MKKFLYSVAVMTLTFLAASCQQENLEPMEGGDTVTYTVQVPDAIATKAMGDGFTVYYEVYKEADLVSGKPLYEGHKAFEGGTASLELKFVKNQNFSILFWAQKTQGCTAYDISDLRNVKLESSLSANDADAEVFVGTDKVVNSVSSKNGHVQLIRPVAQLNIATLTSGLTLGVGATVNPQYVSIEIDGLYTSFNVATGVVSTPENRKFAKASAVNTPLDNYTLLSRNFVGFIPKDGDNVDIDFTIYTEGDGNISHSVSNVPVKPNYKTNIIGNLISAASDYSVSVDDQWGADCDDMEVITDGLVKNIEGDYEVTNENGLAYAINNLWASGGTFYLTKSLYDMAGYTIAPPSVSGSLNIYGEIPVVTRAASGGVRITGLDIAALVAEVPASSSALFSNITIDGSTDFVANNKGTIGFNECANNEGDAIQQLVGENTGNIVDLQTEILSLEQLQNVIDTGVKKIVLSKPLINANGSDVILDLKGTAISIVDATENNFEMIKNQGTLVIRNSASETAVMTVRSTTDTGTSRYSAVIANTVGGNLTVQGNIMIEHLGGTYMAYGIDNLTNGKGTYAVVTLDGTTVKSPYRAVRQFLNGVEATNELYVKSGSKLYGENKSIFFHDPSTNANTGKLVVEEGAELYGDVYLFVTEGSTQWPVSVSIASSSLKEPSAVTYKNVPENCKVAEIDGVWTVTSDCVAMIGNTKFDSLQAAVEAVQDGEKVVLMRDIDFSEGVNGNGISYTRGVNFTLDLNGKTVTSNLGNNALRFKIGDGNDVKNTEVTISVKNGTVVSAESNWCAISAATADNSGNKLILNLDNLNVENFKPNDYAVKSWSGAVIHARNVNVISSYGGGFYAVGGEIVLDNSSVDQVGLHTAPYNSMALAVSNAGKMTVNSGKYTAVPAKAEDGDNQGTTHGSWAAGVMNSGGELIINGGTFANGNYGDDALATYARGIIFGDTASKIVINDGIFNALKSIIDYQNNLGIQPNPNIMINGGNFSADPSVVTSYGGVEFAEGKGPVQGADGRWTIERVQQSNEIWYTGDMKLEPTVPEALNAVIVSNEWDGKTGKGVITFDAPLTAIGNEAFKRITNTTPSNWMTSISLPNSLETIGNNAFYQCFSLTSITIPDSVVSIGEKAFGSCRAATSVTIGSGVKTIASMAFYDLWELKDLICKPTTPPTLADKYVFSAEYKPVKVIVSAGSVDAYKAASLWQDLNIVAE